MSRLGKIFSESVFFLGFLLLVVLSIYQRVQFQAEVDTINRNVKENQQMLWDAFTKAEATNLQTSGPNEIHKEDVIRLCTVPQGEDTQVCDPSNFQENKLKTTVGDVSSIYGSNVTYIAPKPFSCAIFSENENGITLKRWHQLTTNQDPSCKSVVVFTKQ